MDKPDHLNVKAHPVFSYILQASNTLRVINLGAKSLQGDEPVAASPRLTALSPAISEGLHTPRSLPEMIQEAERKQLILQVKA